MNEANAIAVLAQRIESLESRTKRLETVDRQDMKDAASRHSEVLERIAKLEARVGFIAAGASVVTTVAILFLKSTMGGS